MALPEHGIAHKVRPVKVYTREQIARKRHNFTPDQAQSQLHRVRTELQARAKTHPPGVVDLVADLLREDEQLWIEIRREAERRAASRF